MKRGYDRTERVGDLIQKELAQILLHGMDDDRFRLVTITSVNVARDLSFAKVFVSVLLDNEAEIKDMIAQLNRHAKSLRYQLVKVVKLRIAPELRFVYDESTARGFHLSNLIDSAFKKSNKE